MATRQRVWASCALDESGRVIGFLEKPQTEEEIDRVRMDPTGSTRQGIASGGRDCLASMGIYIFNQNVLQETLEETDHQDFGEKFSRLRSTNGYVQVHLFDGYWEDIGTIGSFYDANLQLAQPDAPFQLATDLSPIFSRARFLPPTRVDGANVENSLVADGCVIEPGARIENSVIGLRCHIGRDVTIRNSVVMGADFYETASDLESTGSQLQPIGIGAGSSVERAIVDKNCRIGPGSQIVNQEQVEEGDLGEFCAIRDGILVVEKDASLPSGWHP